MASLAKLGDAVNQESDIFAEFFFDFFERERGVFNRVVQNAGDNGGFVHVPIFEQFLDGERMNNVGFAGFAELAFVGFGGDFDCFLHFIHANILT